MGKKSNRGVLCLVLIAAALTIVMNSASADVRRLTVNFGNGCRSNSVSCTIQVSATGTGVSGKRVVLQYAGTRGGVYQLVSNRRRALDGNGRTSFRFRNFIACFRSVTAPNGSARDVVSNVICERNSGSSSSGSSSSSSSQSSNSSSSNSSSTSSNSSNSSNSSSSSSSSSSGNSSSSSSSDDD